jgi:UDP-2,3-diacylglucosamine pyrophosphatase LpxH
MEEKIKIMKDLSIEEREEVFVDIARVLERTAREAYVEGNRHFALASANMAQAIRVNADELAREDVQSAERVLLEATSIISQFNAAHPYAMTSHAIH